MKYLLWMTGLSLSVASSFAQAQMNCSQVHKQSAYDVETQALAQKHDPKAAPDILLSYGAREPLKRAFEKEGLFYEEVAEWFPSIKKGVTGKIDQAFQKEMQNNAIFKRIHYWLRNATLDPNYFNVNPQDRWIWAHWESVKSPEQRWRILSQQPNFFKMLSVSSKSKLFEYSILTFDDVLRGPKTPDLVTIGDDLGSYEVRSTRAIPSRSEFQSIREITEKYLEGKVGHQHIFHSWPENAAVRKQMAPYYIELLDATSWYLYTRQLVRNPEQVDSLLVHPFLGIYSTATLNNLHGAVVRGRPDQFRSKYNMIGARSFPPLDATKEQVKNKEVPADRWATDWELRSGPKSLIRDSLERMVEARLTTGDYTGLKDYRQHDFSTQRSIQDLAKPHVTAEQLKILTRFAETLPEMRDAHFEVANNHYQKRILAPLFNWKGRLDLAYKDKIVSEAQAEYAVELTQIAEKFLRRYARARDNESKKEVREDAIAELELANYRFYTKTRLDLDFERYLKIKPGPPPSPLFTAQRGPIDVNTIGLGIEYSVRFPKELTPESKGQAQTLIGRLSTDLSKNFGATTQPVEAGGNSHGHNLVVKYKLKDSTGAEWRVEWDGISRGYSAEGKVTEAWGGHVEIVSPKFSPQTVEGPISTVYQTARQHGMLPKRSAGGAHVNFDIGFLQQMPVAVGTRRLSNLIGYFESNQEIMLALWMHPLRRHAAFPAKPKEGFNEALQDFKGTWNDYGRMLYEYRYFNVYEGRKPKYVPLNLTALMSEIVPRDYINRSLDIKNPTNEWFPNFADVQGRGEARFFDAPLDEAMAALQIKYWRAVMNKTFNSSNPITIQKRFNEAQFDLWKSDPHAWKQAVEAHLRELGLDPQEFTRLIWDSYEQNHNIPIRSRDLKEHQDFLPPETVGKLPVDLKLIIEKKSELEICKPTPKAHKFERAAEGR